MILIVNPIQNDECGNKEDGGYDEIRHEVLDKSDG
jgi:hypothetical protein